MFFASRRFVFVFHFLHSLFLDPARFIGFRVICLFRQPCFFRQPCTPRIFFTFFSSCLDPSRLIESVDLSLVFSSPDSKTLKRCTPDHTHLHFSSSLVDFSQRSDTFRSGSNFRYETTARRRQKTIKKTGGGPGRVHFRADFLAARGPDGGYRPIDLAYKLREARRRSHHAPRVR